MTVKYRVTYVESERGWGQKYDHADFDSFAEAEKFRDDMNDHNLGGSERVPDWYMMADEKILVIGQKLVDVVLN